MSWGVTVKGGREAIEKAFDEYAEQQKGFGQMPAGEIEDVGFARNHAAGITDIVGDVEVTAGGSWMRPFVDGEPGEWARSSFYIRVNTVI